ncbi:MAG: DUF6261 family protein [Prevotellaceae bacterium]|jgi:chorismate mutase|nr:DUF6261 family protein [Prevotellaceae bacterium]
MKKFLKLTTPRLKRGAFFSFMMSIYTLASANKLVSQKAAKFVEALHIALTHVDEALAVQRTSEYTRRIVSLNDQRMIFFSSLKKAVTPYLKNETTAPQAQLLLDIFKDYGIKRGIQFDQLNGLFANLITDLEGKAAAAVKALNLQSFVSNIKGLHTQILELAKERLDETDADGIARLKIARAQATEAYRQLLEVVESLALMDGTGAYDDFIDRVNTEIKHYKQDALGEKVSNLPGGGNTGGGGNSDGDEEEPPQG